MTKLFHFILTFVYFIPNVLILSLLCLEIVIKETLEKRVWCSAQRQADSDD